MSEDRQISDVRQILWLYNVKYCHLGCYREKKDSNNPARPHDSRSTCEPKRKWHHWNVVIDTEGHHPEDTKN